MEIETIHGKNKLELLDLKKLGVSLRPPPKPISQKMMDFLFANWELYTSKQLSIAKIIKLLSVPEHPEKYPTQQDFMVALLSSKCNGMHFNYKLTEISTGHPTLLSFAEYKFQDSFLIGSHVFHIPRMYDVLESVTVTPKFCADNLVIHTKVYLDGTILSQSLHSTNETLPVNISSYETIFGSLRVDVRIFSESPIFRQTDCDVSIRCTIFRSKWIKEMIEHEFHPIQPLSSLYQIMRRSVMLQQTPPLMMNGWPFRMPYTLFPMQHLRVGLTVMPLPGIHGIMTKNGYQFAKPRVEETELPDGCFLVFPSGVEVSLTPSIPSTSSTHSITSTPSAPLKHNPTVRTSCHCNKKC